MTVQSVWPRYWCCYCQLRWNRCCCWNQGQKLPVDCDASEGYVTEEDETADAEQMKKSGKRVSTHCTTVVCKCRVSFMHTEWCLFLEMTCVHHFYIFCCLLSLLWQLFTLITWRALFLILLLCWILLENKFSLCIFFCLSCSSNVQNLML